MNTNNMPDNNLNGLKKKADEGSASLILNTE